MKAIIEVAKRGAAIRGARQQIAASRRGQVPDFRLSFESAKALFADLTPARLELLDTLRRVGPCSVYALAKAAERNYSNVHTDIGRLEEIGLVERKEEAPRISAVRVSGDSGPFGAGGECCLTPRSSRAPTAGHQARSGGTRYIFASSGLASCRSRPLRSLGHRKHASCQRQVL